MISEWLVFLITTADEDILGRPGRALAAVALITIGVILAAWIIVTEWFWPLGLAIVAYWLYRCTMLVLDKEKK